jgi:hypothetical protein
MAPELDALGGFVDAATAPAGTGAAAGGGAGVAWATGAPAPATQDGASVGAAATDGDDAPTATARGPRAMRWNNNTSGFVLRRIGQPVSDSSGPNKVFKDKDVNHVAKAPEEVEAKVV